MSARPIERTCYRWDLMTGTRREILREAIELRRKQDICRDRVYRRSTASSGTASKPLR